MLPVPRYCTGRKAFLVHYLLPMLPQHPSITDGANTQLPWPRAATGRTEQGVGNSPMLQWGREQPGMWMTPLFDARLGPEGTQDELQRRNGGRVFVAPPGGGGGDYRQHAGSKSLHAGRQHAGSKSPHRRHRGRPGQSHEPADANGSPYDPRSSSLPSGESYLQIGEFPPANFLSHLPPPSLSPPTRMPRMTKSRSAAAGNFGGGGARSGRVGGGRLPAEGGSGRGPRAATSHNHRRAPRGGEGDTWESDVLGGRQRTRERVAEGERRARSPTGTLHVLRPETAKAMALGGALPAVSWKAWFGEKKVSLRATAVATT